MVLNQFLQQILSGRLLQLPALSLLLAAGVTTSGATPILASGLETPAPLSQAQALGTRSVALGQLPGATTTMPDGVYLYGQSSTPEQIGKEYLVFEVRSGKVAGAVYMPASEFNCFHGTLESNQLNLSLVNPEDNTTQPYSIALEKTTQVAQAGGGLASPNSVTLVGYHRIANMSKNDQRLLSSCKASAHK
jgi:hypothetical protein